MLAAADGAANGVADGAADGALLPPEAAKEAERALPPELVAAAREAHASPSGVADTRNRVRRRRQADGDSRRAGQATAAAELAAPVPAGAARSESE
mmetsp:Transcript_1909/g.6201  ORF Transcript_1909/g.6201 Transcript_1909/m.6201 type:complete len:96 (+) Transcript_1909:1-288(+)